MSFLKMIDKRCNNYTVTYSSPAYLARVSSLLTALFHNCMHACVLSAISGRNGYSNSNPKGSHILQPKGQNWLIKVVLTFIKEFHD